jgi:hypothetical protein
VTVQTLRYVDTQSREIIKEIALRKESFFLFIIRQEKGNDKPADCLLQWDEAGRVGRSNSWTSVSHRSIKKRIRIAAYGLRFLNSPVGNRELSEVVSNHFWLNFDLVEDFSVVNSQLGSNHLRNDDHVSEVSLDGNWFVERTTG